METASVEPASQFHSPPGARARSTNIGAGEGSRQAEGGGGMGISLSPPSAPCPAVSAPTCTTLKRVQGHPAVLLSATLCTVTMPVTTGCISTGQKSCGWNQSRPLSQLPRSLPMPGSNNATYFSFLCPAPGATHPTPSHPSPFLWHQAGPGRPARGRHAPTPVPRAPLVRQSQSEPRGPDHMAHPADHSLLVPRD